MTTNQEAPKPLTFSLLRILADGEFHSGETMARQLSVSRAGVNSALKDIESYGLQLYRVQGRGYRLLNPATWLNVDLIQQYLDVTNRKRFSIDILESAPSSNTLLLQRATEHTPSGSVLAIEWQSSGRGRMGRPWHSGLGNALTFSLLWRFEQGLSALSGLSLAVGLAMVHTLRSFGTNQVFLKWPNDLVDSDGKKLGGILIEAQGDMLGPSVAVIGIGLNVSLPNHLFRRIDQAANSLSSLLGSVPDRNHLLAVSLLELDKTLRAFVSNSFAAMKSEWELFHAHQDKPVRLSLPNGQHLEGIARGVTPEGALCLETKTGLLTLHAGEISLRSHAAD